MMKIVYKGKTKSGKEFIIRYPEISDAKDMTRYMNELSKERTYISFQGEELTLQSEKEYLEAFIKSINEKRAVKLLVMLEDKIIGISDIQAGDKIRRHLGLFGITIAKDFRNQGIGRILMGIVLKEAKKNMPSLKIVILEVFAKNSIAKRIYEGFGFRKYGFLPKGIALENSFDDAIWMYKNI